VNNTCAYKSVAVIISKPYIDHPKYKTFIDSVNHQFLNFCTTLAINGSSKLSYKDRLKIHENCGVSGINIIDTECNVTFIISELLKEFSSAYKYFTCYNKNCKSPKEQQILCTITLQNQELIEIKYLKTSMVRYVEVRNYLCQSPSCHG